MLYSKLFGKTVKAYPKDEIAVNAKLLLKAGFIDKLMAGSYTLLPLGRLVERKIEEIVRQEMNATGAQEVLMPLLHPKTIWNETGRWESAKEVMYQFAKDDKEYALSFTHEEIVMDLIRKHIAGRKDLPVKIYHFSTKFRDEPRAKSGLLRGREFIMKDLYSAHENKEDMMKYYAVVTEAYMKTFARLNLEVRKVEASGGVFTKEHTREFQVLAEGGEDTIYFCDQCDFAQNKEIFTGKEKDTCPKCQKGKIISAKAIEVGNIFPLGTYYAEKMNVLFADVQGNRKPVWLASYGIGITRLIATIAEVFHDDRGLIWPEAVAPFPIHLVGLDLKDETINSKVHNVYKVLEENNIDVLFDDRTEASAGEKFSDVDLIGIPYRLVVSKRTGEQIEFKKRNEKTTTLLDLSSIISKIKA